MPKKIENMSDQELMDAWTQAGSELEAWKVKVKEYAAEFHQREAVKAAAVRMSIDPDNMTDDVRAALLQVVEAQGIESQEKVGAES
jgi:hypothetical protein